MNATELAYLSIGEASALIRRKEVSPLELTQSALDRIAAIDGNLHSFVTPTPDLALAQARQVQEELASGCDRGPLHGIPFALKDLYNTKDIRTTGHSRVLHGNIPDHDATVTAKLREAGTALLGKLAMHEFAFGTPGMDTAFPPARNPWNLEYMPGGSSSGSGAALAAGLCYGSLGSDTGGSIRGPASFCGIAGLKPTYGRVSRYGVLPLSWSLDHVGPMARTVEDNAIILQAIAGYDPLDPASADVPVDDYSARLKDGVAGLKLGLPRSWYDEGDGTDPEVMTAFEGALDVLKSQGASVVELDGAPFINARPANMLILITEAYAYHEETLKSRPDLYGAGVRDRVREGAFLGAADYIDAQRARSVITAQVRDMLKAVDCIVSPATPRWATPFEGFDTEAGYKRPSYTNPFNLTGLPAMSVPCGFSSEGMPIGFQIAGRAFDEATVLRVAFAHEQATAWHTKHPPV